MFVDDGTWASRLALKDKAQSTVQDLAGLIKAANVDAELPESLTETARQFATLDGTMKTTRQNMTKLSQVLRQVQEANFHLLDNLRATNEATESLRIQPPLTRAP
ncbi:hypothetical protein EMPS_10712 [Entomortierella parvispora]|uniref:BLOC-1-related complex subunit 7 n=1 Tax=Entomortierella parvispora TaxID=205924 RepID=A0A9P3M1J2_9FUNG|nr:hypothetical protein EMPS_10712 [Entomortierella parvispora]